MAASAEAVGPDEGTSVTSRQLVATLLAISFGTILECECCSGHHLSACQPGKETASCWLGIW